MDQYHVDNQLAEVPPRGTQCQYAAIHTLRKEDAPAVRYLDCGLIGAVPACQPCADLYARMSEATKR